MRIATADEVLGAPAFVPTVELADVLAHGLRIRRRSISRAAKRQSDPLNAYEQVLIRLVTADLNGTLREVRPGEPLTLEEAMRQLEEAKVVA